ncbi:MAG: prepilin peptidase [bacterium]|nr:prepilin peptidase [bacterium]
MFFILTFFTLGLIVGSFLNVAIYRYNTERSLGGRSACMSCQQKLCWQELLPLASFLILRGRCGSCKTKISWQYPLVEFISGVVFAAIFIKFQDIFFTSTVVFAFSYLFFAFMFSLLLVISVYDLKHKIIPDALVLAFDLLAFIGLFLFLYHNFAPHVPSLSEIFSGAVVALPFALLWFVSRGAWMGLGDAKLAIGLGWMLGTTLMFSGAVVAFWLGAIVGLVLIFFSRISLGRYGLKSEIPFAPFLAFGAFLVFIFEFNFFPLLFN